MTFARTIVEQNIVLNNVLQLPHKLSRTFLEQFQSSSRTQFYKIVELFKNSSRPFCRGAQVFKKHQFAYKCKSAVCSHDIRGAFGKFLAWSYISVTDLQTLSCLVSF